MLTTTFSPALEVEIRYLMDGYADNPDHEPGDWRAEAIREVMQEMDDPDHWASGFRAELRAWGVRVGIYREITPAVLAATVTCGRGGKYDFKRGGEAYVFTGWGPLES